MSDDTMTPDLLPCPFCGAGETSIRVNHGTWRGVGGYGEPISVEVRHWCTPVAGQPQRGGITFVGRDEASAVARWNARSDAAIREAVAAETERCVGVLDDICRWAGAACERNKVYATASDDMTLDQADFYNIAERAGAALPELRSTATKHSTTESDR